MANEIYDAACEYAQLGLAVIPIHRSNGHAAFRYRDQDEPLPGADYHKYFGDGEYNLGIRTGDSSAGVVSLVADDWKALEYLQERHPQLTKSLPCSTTAKGWQFFFKAPPGERVSKSAYLPGAKYPSLHLLGNGKHAVAAPSWRHDGKGYPRNWDWNRKFPGTLSYLPEIPPGTFHPYFGQEYPPPTPWHLSTPTPVGGKGDIWIQALAAAHRYQPSGAGSRNSSLLALVRFLKGLVGDGVTVEQMEPVFRTWHTGILGKSYVENKDYKYNWQTFKHTWKGVKLDNRKAFQVLTHGYAPPWDANGRTRLWMLCEMLALWDPDRQFYLAGETAGQFIGVSQQTVSKWLREFCQQGRLEIVAEYNQFKRIARTYRMLQV